MVDCVRQKNGNGIRSLGDRTLPVWLIQLVCLVYSDTTFSLDHIHNRALALLSMNHYNIHANWALRRLQRRLLNLLDYHR